MEATHSQQNRYHRQSILPQIGPAGQHRLSQSRVLLIGCGALGTVMAEQLTRAGVGYLRIVDRDLVESTNLQRQTLFDEADVAANLPKAVAAQRRLGRINSSVGIDAHVADVHSGNIEQLVRIEGGAADLILDGTDNVQTRYLINDITVKHRVPWVYGGCVGVDGRVMPVWPEQTPCLRCLFPDPPAPGTLPTCDTAGVLGPAATVVGAIQSTIAMRILIEQNPRPDEQLLSFDLWTARFKPISLAAARRSDCICCGQKHFEFLSQPADVSVSLCGREAVQIRPSSAKVIDLQLVAKRLSAAGQTTLTPFFVKCDLRDPAEVSLTLFPDGRLIVHGTTDPGRARSIQARFLGR